MENLRKGLQILAILLLSFSTYSNTQLITQQQQSIQNLETALKKQDSVSQKLMLKIDSVMVLHPWHKPKSKRFSSCPGNFLGFVLYKDVNTNGISSALTGALEAYTGPKGLITSLRRNWGTGSDHEKGRAVDFDLSGELVDFLVSEDGKK